MGGEKRETPPVLRVRLTQMLADHCGGEDDFALTLAPGELTAGAALRTLTGLHAALGPLVWTADGAFNDQLVAFLNQEDLRRLQGLETPLQDGDELMLITAVEGG